MKNLFSISLLLLMLVVLSPLSAQTLAKELDSTKTPPISQQEELGQKLKAAFPSLKGVTLEESEVAGVYRFWTGNNLNHVRLIDGHIMIGDLYNIERGVSLASEAKKERVKSVVENINESQMIVFPAKQQKRVVNVFTDVDCGFCRKMHTQVQALTDAGITVRYIAFPAFSRDIEKHVSVWCADDPQQAMTQAKQGKAVLIKTCDTTVEQTLRTGFELGFRGTPQIIYDDGRIIGGYRSAKHIIHDMDLDG